MRIEEAKNYLEVENLGISTTCKHFKANVKAMEIMEKYQKIEQIIKDWENGRFSDAVGCLRVKAVLNGNDD